jgi:hypothetical protein
VAVVAGEPERVGGWLAAAEGAEWMRLAKARAAETRKGREARVNVRCMGKGLRRNRRRRLRHRVDPNLCADDAEYEVLAAPLSWERVP